MQLLHLSAQAAGLAVKKRVLLLEQVLRFDLRPLVAPVDSELDTV
jgi:hypothetical protein